MAEKPKAVVLLSGGMDSTVTAAIASRTHRLALLHASYGQRTERRERRAFDEIADFYGVRDRLVVRFDAFAQIGGSALTDDRIVVPESGAALAPDGGVAPAGAGDDTGGRAVGAAAFCAERAQGAAPRVLDAGGFSTFAR
jgi:7-cyano-7-deazaguanine synthase in queuosine biosynthesis